MELVKLAQKDYEYAIKNYEYEINKNKKFGTQLFLNKICNDIEQCVEKWLKAIIEIAGISYAKAHNINDLVAEAVRCCEIIKNNNKNNEEIQQLFNKIIYFINIEIAPKATMLTDWSVEPRYNWYADIDQPHVERALKMCEEFSKLLSEVEKCVIY